MSWRSFLLQVRLYSAGFITGLVMGDLTILVCDCGSLQLFVLWVVPVVLSYRRNFWCGLATAFSVSQGNRNRPCDHHNAVPVAALLPLTYLSYDYNILRSPYVCRIERLTIKESNVTIFLVQFRSISCPFQYSSPLLRRIQNKVL